MRETATSKRSSEPLGLLLGFLGVLTFSLTLPATREAVKAFDAWTVTFGRAMIASACAAAVLAITKAPRPDRKYYKSLVISAAGAVVGFPLFIGLALETSTASRGAVVIGILPASTALVATIRHRERPSWQFWLAALGGLITVVTFSVLTGADGKPELGDVFFLLAVASAAFGYTEGAALTKDLGGWQTISWALIISTPITLPATAIALALGEVNEPGVSNWIGLAYVSLFSMYLGYFAWYGGLSIGGIARVSQIQLLQPILTLVWAAILLGESITIAGAITAALVLLFVVATKQAQIGSANPQ